MSCPYSFVRNCDWEKLLVDLDSLQLEYRAIAWRAWADQTGGATARPVNHCKSPVVLWFV
jgi:hypothetical protein